MANQPSIMNELAIRLHESWQFFGANLKGISAIIVPPVALVTILSAILVSDSYWFVALSFILYPFYQGALVFYIASAAAQDTLPYRRCYQFAARVWLRLAVLYIITSLVIGLGTLAFVIPGLVLLGRFAFAEFYAVLESAGVSQSMNTSWDATKGAQWVLILGLAVILIGVYGAQWLVWHALSSIGAANMVVSSVIEIVFWVLSTLPTIFAFRVYQLENASNSG